MPQVFFGFVQTPLVVFSGCNTCGDSVSVLYRLLNLAMCDTAAVSLQALQTESYHCSWCQLNGVTALDANLNN
jgi:hypothetical protein